MPNVEAQATDAASCGRSPGAQGWAWMHDCKTCPHALAIVAILIACDQKAALLAKADKHLCS